MQLSGSHISNYYESHAYMQVHVLTTDWVKYRTNTKTSNVSWLTDIGRDGVHCICIANNCVTCITRAYLTLLGTGSCTRALTIGNFSSKNCFLGKIFKQIYLNAKKQKFYTVFLVFTCIFHELSLNQCFHHNKPHLTEHLDILIDIYRNVSLSIVSNSAFFL